MTETSRTLTEAEIRPDHLMQKQAEAVASDIEWLIARRTRFVEVECPACASERTEATFEKAGLFYRICPECGTAYMSPRPSPDLLAQFYANSENYAYWNTYIFPASEDARREKIMKPRVERLAKIFDRNGVKPHTIMEIGAGFGTFCAELSRAQLGTRVIAVEATPSLAETCRRKGIDVHEGPFEEVETVPGGSVDAIVAFEVIEHLFSPRDFFRKSWSLLAPGGLLVVTCPSFRGFDLVVLREVSGSIDHEHLNYFHPRSIVRLAETCGYDTVEVSTPGRLDAEIVRKKTLAGEFSLAGQPFLAQVLLEEWATAGEAFQRFLADNLLSSHMWLVARKKG